MNGTHAIRLRKILIDEPELQVHGQITHYDMRSRFTLLTSRDEKEVYEEAKTHETIVSGNSKKKNIVKYFINEGYIIRIRIVMVRLIMSVNVGRGLQCTTCA